MLYCKAHTISINIERTYKYNMIFILYYYKLYSEGSLCHGVVLLVGRVIKCKCNTISFRIHFPLQNAV